MSVREKPFGHLGDFFVGEAGIGLADVEQFSLLSPARTAKV